MSRTPLFAAVKKALAVASHENGVVWPRSSALTRRQLLRLSAAAAGAPALAPVLDRRAYAKKPGPSSIAIVGVVVAGLTAAYRLQQHGAKPVLFEASNRWADACSPNTTSIKACSASSVANSSAPAMKIAEPRLRGRRGDADLTSVWRSPNSGLPAPSNGTFYSDLGFQNLWETSRVQPGEAGIITDYLGPNLDLATLNPRSTPSGPIFPRCRKKWPTASIPMRSRPGSGASIRSRLAAMPAPKRDNTPHCLTWWRNPRSTAVCYLPASIPWRSPKR